MDDDIAFETPMPLTSSSVVCVRRQLRQIKKLRVKLINNYYAFRCFADIRPILLPTYCKFKVSC